ncbi:hypothetical protein AQ946_05630 [Burkholderia pseudomallei]|nr:hypothetical protein AQ766_27325 [Burkholderia pseudomallei]ONE15040.1 hypothetical protein AQ946_05630 [Burkholderia pseudomallei]ONE40758.1 hypothetical protein AQ948_12540 [Burkholderia pseudomallei]ONE41900.1 hypothetical protein AQ947_09985 [Burkholderia pseudomallei]
MLMGAFEPGFVMSRDFDPGLWVVLHLASKFNRIAEIQRQQEAQSFANGVLFNIGDVRIVIAHFGHIVDITA